MADKPRDGISVYVAAWDARDTRALFEKAMALAATGERFEGSLIRADPPRGCAQLYTHLSRGHAATESESESH